VDCCVFFDLIEMRVLSSLFFWVVRPSYNPQIREKLIQIHA